NAINKGHHLTAVFEQADLLVPIIARAGIGLTPKIRVTAQHMASISNGLGQHIRASAHRPLIKAEVMLSHVGLMIKTIGLPRDRRSKSHGQPIRKLWVFAFDPKT